MAELKRVIRTTYDGYITVVWGKSVKAYEGAGLCPPRIQRWLKDNEPEQRNCFWYELKV